MSRARTISVAEARVSADVVVKEYNVNFAHVEGDLKERARTRAFAPGLRSSSVRSIYWKMFLGCLSSESASGWTRQTEGVRKKYSDLLSKFLTNPADADDTDVSKNNPLTASEDSPWSKFFEDSELCDRIRLDLSRTHPENEFFAREDVQSQLLNILFIWCRLNPKYSYRQGMNELLAPILLTVFEDSRPRSEFDGVEGGADISVLLDRDYTEHDAFGLFDKLMRHMAQFFEVVDQAAVRQKARAAHSDGIFADHKPVDTPLVAKCGYVHHKLLGKVDPPLYRHLEANDVHPQVYMLRWIRLLFCREFHLEDVRRLWDAFFADSIEKEDGFSIADYMCVSMCLFVRSSLLQGDNSFCLRRLLKYPPVEDVSVLLESALNLRRPGSGGSVSSMPGPPQPRSQPPSRPSTFVGQQHHQSRAHHGGNNQHRHGSQEQQRSGNERQRPYPQSSASETLSNVKDSFFSFIKGTAAVVTGSTGAANNTNSEGGAVPQTSGQNGVVRKNNKKQNRRKDSGSKEQEAIIFLQREVRRRDLIMRDTGAHIAEIAIELSKTLAFVNRSKLKSSGDDTASSSPSPSASGDEESEEDMIQKCVARLKQIRDVMSGTLSFESYKKDVSENPLRPRSHKDLLREAAQAEADAEAERAERASQPSPVTPTPVFTTPVSTTATPTTAAVTTPTKRQTQPQSLPQKAPRPAIHDPFAIPKSTPKKKASPSKPAASSIVEQQEAQEKEQKKKKKKVVNLFESDASDPMAIFDDPFGKLRKDNKRSTSLFGTPTKSPAASSSLFGDDLFGSPVQAPLQPKPAAGKKAVKKEEEKKKAKETQKEVVTSEQPTKTDEEVQETVVEEIAVSESVEEEDPKEKETTAPATDEVDDLLAELEAL